MSSNLFINFELPKIKNSDFVIKVTWIIAMLILALIQLWAYRFFEHYSDGIAYLDMADAWLCGDWQGGFTAYWNPIYPLVIMGVFSILRPSALYEFAALKAVNYLIFVLLIIAFEHFLQQLLDFYKKQMQKEKNSFIVISTPIWSFLAHAVFAYAYLCLSSISVDTPDMLMSVFLFTAFTFALKILSGDANFKNFILFACLAGLAYLAKNAALIIVFACLFCFCLQRKNIDRFWQKLILATAVLAIIIAPYVICLSLKQGHFTLSESGKITYFWFVQERDCSLHAQNNEALRKTLLHPTRRILKIPMYSNLLDQWEALIHPGLILLIGSKDAKFIYPWML